MDEKKFFLKISASHWAVPVLEQGNRALSLLLGKAELLKAQERESVKASVI